LVFDLIVDFPAQGSAGMPPETSASSEFRLEVAAVVPPVAARLLSLSFLPAAPPTQLELLFDVYQPTDSTRVLVHTVKLLKTAGTILSHS
jgi:hypothetical protein